MILRQRYDYAKHLFSTLITAEEWRIIKRKRDANAMKRKHEIVLAMVSKGLSQNLISMVLDTDATNVNYWLRNEREMARKIKRQQRRLTREGMAEFQLYFVGK